MVYLLAAYVGVSQRLTSGQVSLTLYPLLKITSRFRFLVLTLV